MASVSKLIGPQNQSPSCLPAFYFAENISQVKGNSRFGENAKEDGNSSRTGTISSVLKAYIQQYYCL